MAQSRHATHKSKKSVKAPVFEVLAVVAGPDVDEEELFILNEREWVEAQIADYKRKGWLPGLINRLGGPSLDRWRRYSHALDVYTNVIDQYNYEMSEGIIPFRVVVTNLSSQPERNIRIRLTVKDGAILLAKRPPERPERPDGVQHVPEQTTYRLFGGFIRRNIRIGTQTISAEFSKLAAGDDAALVNETLFLQMDPGTSLEYELSTDSIDGIRGSVQM
jgi:hypothetical protein